ncbi:MAG: acetolactate decarboxylase [Eubacterium sp.]|nr:acetolactate decarboxylase [Eubacterium sp.]
MFQVSTIQALMLGYSRSVITVSELLKHGNIGLGTFEDVDGEMICLDEICYRATENGTLVCVYFPDYMDGINAAGWHLHFVSEDRKQGGHVFEISMKRGTGILDKINSIEIKLPEEPVFDTYSLKSASNNDIKQVEQGKA